MPVLRWMPLILYLSVAAGYGGWRGADLFSNGIVFGFLLPPLIWAATKSAGQWRRNPYWISAVFGVLLTTVTTLAIGGQALVLAWVAAESTARISSTASVRAVVAACAMAAGCALVAAATGRGAKKRG